MTAGQSAPDPTPRAEWLDRFVSSVRGFNAALDATTARGLAESEYRESNHLSPEEAAEAFAARGPATGNATSDLGSLGS